MRFALCIDDTEFSEEAVAPLRALAEAAGAEVDIVHVLVVEPPNTGEPWSGSSDAARARIEKQLEAKRGSALDRLTWIAAAFRVPTNIEIRAGGDAAGALLQYCEERQPNLIALTTRSKSTMGEPRLGSVAQKLTLSGTVPVFLIYPREERFAERTALAPGTFVFTCDGIEVGKVKDVRGDLFCVSGADHEDWWLQRKAAAGINSGRLVLHYRRSEVAKHVQAGPHGA
jgi:nucleotide-binding universal stress UspA family protein